MNKAITFILGAAVGATAGSLITWKLIDDKYKKIADEEIESVIERFKNREKASLEIINDTPNIVLYNKENTEVQTEEYSEIVDDLGYSENNDYTICVDPYDETVAPYVISPDEYGEVYDYDKKSYTYYADNILAEDGEIIVDLDNTIGDALDHFGEYEEDSVHVRNENIGCDIEILKHEKTFSEVYGEDS